MTGTPSKSAAVDPGRTDFPKVRWYRPEMNYWIHPTTGALEVDEGVTTGFLLYQGYELAAVRLIAARGVQDRFTLVRSDFLHHPQIEQEVGSPNVSAGSPSPFRWGGEVPVGWSLWKEDLAPERRVLRLVR